MQIAMPDALMMSRCQLLYASTNAIHVMWQMIANNVGPQHDTNVSTAFVGLTLWQHQLIEFGRTLSINSYQHSLSTRMFSSVNAAAAAVDDDDDDDGNKQTPPE